MNATFFGLALLSALSPKLLGVDLLLINIQRRKLMFAYCLLGGLGIALTVGLLDVFVLQADAIELQGSISAGLDLGLGAVALVVGALIATGHLHRAPRTPAPAGQRRPSKMNDWAQQILSTPRYGRIVLIGIVCGLPGAKYLAALHTLVTGKSSTAMQAVAVIVFVLLEFSLMIIPFVSLMIRPDGTGAQISRTQAWFSRHARELLAAVLLGVGAYMAISGLVRLIG
jgi:hypothetical protein